MRPSVDGMVDVAGSDLTITTWCADCLEVFPRLPWFDAIVTDPPYGLEFLGAEWDRGVPGVEFWRAMLEVVKPGAWLVAFGAPRLYHRLVCAIEDAGWEIRDTVMWVFGGGYAKSLDVGKAIDSLLGAEREVIGRRKHPTLRDPAKLEERAGACHGGNTWSREWDLTAPATEASKQWDGWGTGIKPSYNPICLARKPLEGTVAGNVLEYGVGALNIDACRIEVVDAAYERNCSGDRGHAGTRAKEQTGATSFRVGGGSAASGRYPANFVHDGSAEVAALFPEVKSGLMRAGTQRKAPQGGGGYAGGFPDEASQVGTYGDSGSAARFFYCARASKSERGAAAVGEKHPTVKPLALMRWLVRLVCPLGGSVLDPFAGTFSTAIAAADEGMRAAVIEKESLYYGMGLARIQERGFGFVERQVW